MSVFRESSHRQEVLNPEFYPDAPPAADSPDVPRVFLPELVSEPNIEKNPTLPTHQENREFKIVSGSRYAVPKFILMSAIERGIGDKVGGTASIVFGEDTQMDRPIVIKLLNISMMPMEERQDHYNTARLAANLEDVPRLPQIIDILSLPDTYGRVTPAIVMERIVGHNCKEFIKKERLPASDKEAILVEVLDQMSETLDMLHARGVVHRDVKPENILLRDYPERLESVLIDFENALSTGPYNIARVGATPEYAAPELLGVSEHSISGASDQYSLAITAIHFLRYDTWFVDKGGNDRNSGSIQEKENMQLKEIISPEVTEVLRKATSWNPEERYESCQDFVSALKAALGTPTN